MSAPRPPATGAQAVKPWIGQPERAEQIFAAKLSALDPEHRSLARQMARTDWFCDRGNDPATRMRAAEQLRATLEALEQLASTQPQLAQQLWVGFAPHDYARPDFLSAQPAHATACLPRLLLTDGAVESLKWFALVLMVIDHVNKYLLDWSVPWMFAAGRLAMPVFAMTLGYNLARIEPTALAPLRRILIRLAAVAALSCVPYIALGKLSALGWWPLNILATFAAAVAVLLLWRSGGIGHRLAAVAVFVGGGALVEYFWPAIAIVVGTCAYARSPSARALAVVVTSLALLGLINRNAWALAALPVLALAAQHSLPLPQLPRLRWFFYAAYPAHLAALWVIVQVRA